MVSFIVPVKDGLDYTRALVRSVTERNPGAAVEWIIVDSASTDGTPAYCREIGARVVPFDRRPFNYCAALNAGATAARGDVWILCNNDVEFRSSGDLARLEEGFARWPLLAVASPGRPSGEAPLEFLPERVNGATWAVRPSAWRTWGGMPEALSGYGFDEAWTAFTCWRSGLLNAWLTGWHVHHHGSATFGPLYGNTEPALRRNLSRLLALMDASDLDGPGSPAAVLDRLRRRERAAAPARAQVLLLDASGRPAAAISGPEIDEQGCVNLRGITRPQEIDPDLPLLLGPRTALHRKQWAPWLLNELALAPGADAIAGEEWLAVRRPAPSACASDAGRTALRVSAAAPTLRPPPVMPRLCPRPPTPRQRLAAWLHARRGRWARLPEGW